MTGDPRRILVYGVTGSGKTTLAQQIGKITGLRWHSVDDEIGWLPGWVERPRDEQRDLASRIASSEEWVLDTAYGHWRDVVLPRAELIVALDYPRFVSLARLLRRTARRVLTGELACNGNRESVRQALSTQSIIAWHFRSFSRKRERIAAWEADPSSPPVVRLRSPRVTEEWLAALRERHRVGPGIGRRAARARRSATPPARRTRGRAHYRPPRRHDGPPPGPVSGTPTAG